MRRTGLDHFCAGVHRPPACAARIAALAVLLAGAVTASAQPRAVGSARIAATENTLWLADVRDDLTRIFRRGATGRFESTDPLSDRALAFVAVGDDLYAFVRDGSFYAQSDGHWRRERDFPIRRMPLALAAAGPGGAVLFALIPSPRPGRIPQLVPSASGPVHGAGLLAATQPFDPGDAHVTVVRYDGAAWTAVCAGPLELTADLPDARLGPRLALVRESLYLCWRSSADTIHVAAFDAPSATWRPQPAPPPQPQLRGFWFVAQGGMLPMLVVAHPGADGGEELSAYRLIADTDGVAESWRAVDLLRSPLPDGAGPTRLDDVTAFNQQLAVLVQAGAQLSYVQFARPEAAPTEPTFAVNEFLAQDARSEVGEQWFRMATYAVMLTLMAGLFVFRRGSIVRPVELPAPYELAFVFQRVAAAAIDLVPFAFAAGMMVGVHAPAALQDLFDWAWNVGQRPAADGEPARGALPETRILLWWTTTCAMNVTYGFVMELITQRTVGKVLMGTRVLSESGGRPGVFQVLVRNVLRLVELMPPLWVLAFLVILSRNRQRAGDIFARTVLVRRARPPDAERT